MCVDTATSRLCTVFFVTVCLWLSTMCLWIVTMCLPMSPCVSRCHHMSLDCHNVSVVVTMCLWLSQCVCSCHHVPLVVTMCLWLSPCVSSCHHVPLVVTMCRWIVTNCALNYKAHFYWSIIMLGCQLWYV